MVHVLAWWLNPVSVASWPQLSPGLVQRQDRNGLAALGLPISGLRLPWRRIGIARSSF